MKKVQGEETIQVLMGLELTTHRVRLTTRSTGNRGVLSITLDAVQSVGLVDKDQPALLVAAAIVLFYGLVIIQQFMVGAIGGLILVAMYFATRKVVLEIASAGGRIQVLAAGERENLLVFVEAVEEAKLKRFADHGYRTDSPAA